MPTTRIDFDLTDAAIQQAVREECDSFLREHLRLRDALIVVGGTIFLLFVVNRESRWFWWIVCTPLLATIPFWVVWSVGGVYQWVQLVGSRGCPIGTWWSS